MEPDVENIPEYRCLFIACGRVLQLYTMEPDVENIVYSSLTKNCRLGRCTLSSQTEPC